MDFLTASLSGVIALGVGFGLGWYVRGRGWAGVEVDLNNIKNELSNIKDYLSGKKASTDQPTTGAGNPVQPS